MKKTDKIGVAIWYIIAGLWTMFFIWLLFGCAATETVYYPFTPRHSGIYVENDSIVNGDTLYYFKNESK